jgi:hypothetical protein
MEAGYNTSTVTLRAVEGDEMGTPWLEIYVRVLINLWLFLFAVQAKESFLNRLKKLEQVSHKCVELRGEYVEQIHFLFQSCSLLFPL